MPGDLDPRTIEAALTGRFGRPAKVFSEVGSTNSEALAWAAGGAPEGALVVADHQTAGRGRKGRAWLSAPGRALLFSLVLRPRLPLELVGLLSTGVGVAVAESIQSATRLPTSIKWPNDITVGGRKLAGILIETVLAEAEVAVAVAGVGINVGGLPQDLPSEVAERATSIAAEADRLGLSPPPARSELLARVLTGIEGAYESLRRAEGSDLLARAVAKSDVVGRRVRVALSGGGVLDGTAVGLLESGALEVEVDGEQRAVHAGEIERLRPTD